MTATEQDKGPRRDISACHGSKANFQNRHLRSLWVIFLLIKQSGVEIYNCQAWCNVCFPSTVTSTPNETWLFTGEERWSQWRQILVRNFHCSQTDEERCLTILQSILLRLYYHMIHTRSVFFILLFEKVWSYHHHFRSTQHSPTFIPCRTYLDYNYTTVVAKTFDLLISSCLCIRPLHRSL
jgi:hypothetical protein